MSNCPHIGKMIQQRIEGSNAVRIHISRKLSVRHTAIYAYEKRPALNCATLYNLCEAMSYNFFRDVADTLPAAFPSKASVAQAVAVNPLAAEVAEQAAYIQKLETENALLKELFALGKKG